MCFNHRLRLKQIFAHVTHTRTHTHIHMAKMQICVHSVRVGPRSTGNGGQHVAKCQYKVCALFLTLSASLCLCLSLPLWWHTNAICIIDCDCHLLRLAMQHVASARLDSTRLDSPRRCSGSSFDLNICRDMFKQFVQRERVVLLLLPQYPCCCCCICSFGAVFGGRLFWAWVLVVVVEFRNLFVVKCN